MEVKPFRKSLLDVWQIGPNGRISGVTGYRFPSFLNKFVSPTQISVFNLLLSLTHRTELGRSKLGLNVLSYHNTKLYLGWNTSFKKELASTVSFLFKQVVGIKVRRVGLRYINALTEARHYVSSATDLNIDITINNNPLNRPFNLNFTGDNGNLTTMTRIATKEFVQGVFPADMSAYVDIDTYTQDGFISQSAKEIKQVIDDAHTCLKSTFFDLLPEGIVARLEATT